MDSSSKNRGKNVSYVRIININNLLIGDPQVEVLKVVEGVLVASDMFGIQLNRFLIKKG